MNKSVPERSILHNVPVFPLPNAVLFPSTWLPLYIFEPRYRQMLAEALDGDRRIAIALMREGWEKAKDPVPAHDVVGVGEIEKCRKNPDGTSHIVLKGLWRARVATVTCWTPYRLASLAVIADEEQEFQEREPLHDRLNTLLERKMRLATSYAEAQDIQIGNVVSTAVLTDVAAFFSDLSPQEKQAFLELLQVRERLTRLVAVYEREVEDLESRN